jgi:hypothetical protein
VHLVLDNHCIYIITAVCLSEDQRFLQILYDHTNACCY